MESLEETCGQSDGSDNGIPLKVDYPYSLVHFPWWSRDRAHNTAKFLNTYIELDGNLQLAIKTRVIARTTLHEWLKDERFVRVFESVDKFVTHQAAGIIKEIMLTGEHEKNRLTAAYYWLQAYNPQRWDPGVRREKARIAGELQSSLMQTQISSAQALEIINKDPFAVTDNSVTIEGPASQDLTDKSRYRSNEVDIEQVTADAEQIAKDKGKKAQESTEELEDDK